MRTLKAVLTTLAVVLLAAPPVRAGLNQTNPVREASSSYINTSGYDNEYPWLSGDGKLLLWTREEKNTDCSNDIEGCQRLWVTYIQNWSEVANTPPDQRNLPPLELATPWELKIVNDNYGLDETIKSYAICEEPEDGNPQPREFDNRWRYRFTLYMSIGPEGPGRKHMERAHRVFVVVNKNTQQITNIGMSGSFNDNVIAGSGFNETEPMLTSDGKYLFWASNKFNSTLAEFITTSSPCAQIQQATQTYAQLPASRFAWRDQYLVGPDHQLTAKTNYHSMVERSDGKTALVFSSCTGKTQCDRSQAGNRACQCLDQRDRLQTTGFAGGNSIGPTVIGDCCGASGGLNNSGKRVTHPAISGKQQPDGSWILFFMRQKKIWYTKIKEQ